MLGEGQQFAGYTIVRFLGAGGMGEVYLAQHPRLPRRRDALKLLGRDISADRNFRERFLREADLASTLSHQHVVGVHDRGEDRGQLWIAMDFIDGEDAGQLLRRRYRAGMPTELVAAIITAVGSALDYAHGKGLLHRDVKPANILLSESENPAQRRILLTDFGIARALDDISDLTPTNTTLGTVAYSAPEQLLGQELDGRADQYALAATAYHLLTGSTMFPASNAAVVIGQHLSAAPPVLAAARPELAGLDPVLRAALAKNPQDRFASCTDFARAFAEQAAAGAIPPAAPTAPGFQVAGPAASPPPAPPPADSPRRSAPTKWVAIAAATTAVAAAGVFGLRAMSHSGSTQPAAASSAAAPAAAPPLNPNPSTAAPPPASPPPAPSRVSPEGIVDTVLLSPDELSRLLRGVPVTADPAGGFNGPTPALKMTASSYGPTDHADQVRPPRCVGVVFTADNRVYGDTAVEKMKTESFAPSSYGPNYYGPSRLEQTIAVFPTATDAQNMLAEQKRQWEACRDPVHPLYPEQPDIDVAVTLGYENSRGFTLGPVQQDADIMTISMASNDGLNGADACQQAIGIRNNVIVEARTCQTPQQTISPMVDPDPSWARPDAQRLVTTMLDKIS